MLFYFRESFNIAPNSFGNLLFSKGSIGVSVFFVISGFIMAFTTENINFEKEKTIDLMISFLKKRIIRILPLYFLLTFAWMVLGNTFGTYFSGDGLKRLWHTLLFLPQYKESPILYLGWSLNFEMFFYIVFAISLLFKKYRWHFIFFFFISSSTFGYLVAIENPILSMMTSGLNLFFIIGIAFSFLMQKIKLTRITSILISAVGLLLFTFFLLGKAPPQELIRIVIVSLFVFSFLLFYFKLQVKANRFLVILGDISFSLYLSHPFVEVFFRHFKVEGNINYVYFLFKIAVVIAVAYLLYILIEKNVTKYLKSILIKKENKSNRNFI
jgi:peptidoglycan/LPS O-acetylase OafA/YrhL